MTGHSGYSNICPLCGQDNRCSLVTNAAEPGVSTSSSEKCCGTNASNEQFSCWCADVRLTEQVKAQLKTTTDGQRCLCQRCLDAMLKADESEDPRA